MKGIRIHALGGPEALQLEELPEPTMTEGTVLIRVVAAGVNYADVNVRRGQYIMQPELPFVPGFEVSGTVEKHGIGVDADRFPLGSRVSAILFRGGGYAELALADTADVLALPEGVSLAAGIALPVQGATAFHVLRTVGRLRPGETVLIHAAAGGVGTLAIQLAKLMGAGYVIAVAGGREKALLALDLGAHVAIDHMVDDFVARVREVTHGRGVDLILDSVGGAVRERSFECLAPLGRLVAFGEASGAQADLNAIWPFLRKRSQSLVGFHLSSVIGRRKLQQDAYETLLRFCREGALRIITGQRFQLAEAGAAHWALKTRRSVGKIWLDLEDR